DGWVLFDLLRHDPKTRSVPIHVISGADNIAAFADKGAASVLTKPVAPDDLAQIFREISAGRRRKQRSVLVADADPDRRLTLVEAIRDGVTSVSAIGVIPANSDEVTLSQYDAIVVGLGRSARQNREIAAEFAGHLGDAAARVIV